MPAALGVVPTPAIVWVVLPDITDARRGVSGFYIGNAGRRDVGGAGTYRGHYATTQGNCEECGRNQYRDLFHDVHGLEVGMPDITWRNRQAMTMKLYFSVTREGLCFFIKDSLKHRAIPDKKI